MKLKYYNHIKKKEKKKRMSELFISCRNFVLITSEKIR